MATVCLSAALSVCRWDQAHTQAGGQPLSGDRNDLGEGRVS